jgi:hypothetical protein
VCGGEKGGGDKAARGENGAGGRWGHRKRRQGCQGG